MTDPLCLRREQPFAAVVVEEDVFYGADSDSDPCPRAPERRPDVERARKVDELKALSRAELVTYCTHRLEQDIDPDLTSTVDGDDEPFTWRMWTLERAKRGGPHEAVRFDPNCRQCNYDRHLCPGCGDGVPHGVIACADCRKLP